jgi:hypothetical protein
MGAVANECVELLEGARVEQLVDPLARGELALLVLLRDGLVAARVDGLLAELAQVGELLLVGDRVLLSPLGDSRWRPRCLGDRWPRRLARRRAAGACHSTAEPA